MPICNICGNDLFVDYRSSVKAMCSKCRSLERHRLIRWSLGSVGIIGTERLMPTRQWTAG